MFSKNFKKLFAVALTTSMIFQATVISSASNQEVKRIAGKSRIETSVEMSKDVYESSKNVVLASGFNFADALSAGQLASALDAPLLLSSSDKLDDATSNEIIRLNPENVYVIGGEKSLSKLEIEPTIKENIKEVNVERLEGKDRYETSIKVMEKTKNFIEAEDLLIVSGKNFPDALAATSYMVNHNAIMVLSDGNSYPKSNLNEIAIGGTNQLPLNGFDGKRISGADRYQTALEIAKASFNDNDTAIVANANVFADSLSAVSLTKKYNAPIILTSQNNLTNTTKQYLQNLDNIILVGGEKSISSNILLNPTLEELAKIQEQNKPKPQNPQKPSKPQKPSDTNTLVVGPIGEGRIKGNMNSMIYHLPGQRDYNRIKPEHIRYFKTEKEARAAGYRRALR